MDDGLVSLSSVLDELEHGRRTKEIELAEELTKTHPAATQRIEGQVIAGIMEGGVDAVACCVEAGLTAEAFTNASYRCFYELSVELREKSCPVDRISVEDLALERGLLGKDFKQSILDRIEFCEEAPSSIAYAAGVLADLGRRRELYRVLREHEAQLRTGKRPDEVLDSAQSSFLAMAQSRRGGGHVVLRDVVKEALREMPSAGGSREVVETGMERIDHLIGGYSPGELVLIAARPSMGKTALALSIAHQVAVKRDRPVAFFSLEMGAKALMQRMIAVDSGVPPRGKTTPSSIKRVEASASVLATPVGRFSVTSSATPSP